MASNVGLRVSYLIGYLNGLIPNASIRCFLQLERYLLSSFQPDHAVNGSDGHHNIAAGLAAFQASEETTRRKRRRRGMQDAEGRGVQDTQDRELPTGA